MRQLSSRSTFRNVSTRVALIATFTGLNLATNYVLSPLPNVKLMDAFYFVASYEFGLTVGIPTVIFTRTVYASVNPWGPASGWLIALLVAGDSVFSIAGGLARKLDMFEKEKDPVRRSVSLGLVGLFSALAFDLASNFGTGLLIVGGQNTPAYLWNAWVFGLITMNFPLPMGILHEASDFFFFMSVVPSALVSLKRSGLLSQGPLREFSTWRNS